MIASTLPPLQRGLCTALVLSGFGLSAFFYSSLSHTLFPGKTGDYLLLLALGSSVSFLLGFFLVKILPQDASNAPSNQRRRSSGQMPASGSVDSEQERPIQPKYVRRRTSSDIGGRAWAYSARNNPDSDVTPSESEAEEGHAVSSLEARAEERQGLLQEQSQDGESREVSQQVDKKKSGKEGIDLTGWKLIKEVDFIILFLIMTLISGTGLLVINVSSVG